MNAAIDRAERIDRGLPHRDHSLVQRVVGLEMLIRRHDGTIVAAEVRQRRRSIVCRTRDGCRFGHSDATRGLRPHLKGRPGRRPEIPPTSRHSQATPDRLEKMSTGTVSRETSLRLPMGRKPGRQMALSPDGCATEGVRPDASQEHKQVPARFSVQWVTRIRIRRLERCDAGGGTGLNK